MAFRFDSGRLSKVERTAHGIRADAAVSRAGVLKYPWGNELRPAEELDSQTMRDGMRGLPIVVGHPKGGKITPANLRELRVGHVGDTLRVDAGHAVTPTYIDDIATVADLDAGRLDGSVSLGYDVAHLEQVSGVFEGTPYQAIQRGIVPNHLALVRSFERPRAGETVAMRLDADGDAVFVGRNDSGDTPGRSEQMKITVTIRGVPYIVEAENDAIAHAIAQERSDSEAALKDANGRCDSITAELTAARKELETTRGERDGLKTRLDAASKPEAISAAVKARAELESRARAVLGADAKLEGRTDRDIMETVARTDSTIADPSKLSEDYLRGCFAAMTRDGATVAKREDANARLDGLDMIQQAMGGAGPTPIRRNADHRTAIKASHSAMVARVRGKV